MPLKSPLFIARAKSGLASLPFREDLLQDDLALFAAEIECNHVVLIDETEALLRNRSILQILRNLLMSVTRYQVIMTGTPAVFETVDSVFSPILRQFFRVDVGPYNALIETRDCVTKPLSTIREIKPREIIDLSPEGPILDIHRISAGRPYEIQLLCHFMFKEAQETPGQMKLSADVIDDVIRALGSGHTLSARPLFRIIRKYGEDELKSLAQFLAGDNFLTLPQYELLSATRGTPESLRELEDAFKRFYDDSVLTAINNKIRFTGDALDAIYLKYYALSKGVTMPPSGGPLEAAIGGSLAELLQPLKMYPLAPFALTAGAPDLVTDAEDLLRTLIDPKNHVPTRTAEFISTMLAYPIILEHAENGRPLFLAVIHIENEWMNNRYIFHGSLLDPSLRQALAEIAERHRSLGSTIRVDIEEHSIPPTAKFLDDLGYYVGAKTKEPLALFHTVAAESAYLIAHDVDSAYRELLRADRLNPTRGKQNLGYLAMVKGLFEDAEMHLLAATVSGDADNAAIAWYDLGVLYAKKGDYEKALETIETCITMIPDSDVLCSVLLCPALDGSDLMFPELREPTLKTTAVTALVALRDFLAVRGQGAPDQARG